MYFRTKMTVIENMQDSTIYIHTGIQVYEGSYKIPKTVQTDAGDI